MNTLSRDEIGTVDISDKEASGCRGLRRALRIESVRMS